METALVRKDGTLFGADLIVPPLKDMPENLCGFALVVNDITARKEAEVERERLIQKLTATLTNIKILGGLLSICTSCNRIRDNNGQWHPLEIYL